MRRELRGFGLRLCERQAMNRGPSNPREAFRATALMINASSKLPVWCILMRVVAASETRLESFKKSHEYDNNRSYP